MKNTHNMSHISRHECGLMKITHPMVLSVDLISFSTLVGAHYAGMLLNPLMTGVLIMMS